MPRRESKSRTWIYYYYCTNCGYVTQSTHYYDSGRVLCDNCKKYTAKWHNTELNKYLDDPKFR